MEFVECPHCQVGVTVHEDGVCPSCQRSVHAKGVPTGEGNPYAESNLVGESQPQREQNSIGQSNPYGRAEVPVQEEVGYTRGEKMYLYAAMLSGLFLIGALGVYHFVLIPNLKGDGGVIYYGVVAYWIYLIVLTSTMILNLQRRTLSPIPTLLQCGALTLAIYCLPIGLWGFIMLYRRRRRNSLRQEANL
ncbi:MAG: hypothetical protein AAF483_22365 [Planctomycetota bacterium]